MHASRPPGLCITKTLLALFFFSHLQDFPFFFRSKTADDGGPHVLLGIFPIRLFGKFFFFTIIFSLSFTCLGRGGWLFAFTLWRFRVVACKMALKIAVK